MAAKISAMYKKSGGTNYRHWCHECRYLMRYDDRKRSKCKCLLYGDDGTSATDWNDGWVACKNWKDKDELLKKKKSDSYSDDEQMEGQMSFKDFGL